MTQPPGYPPPPEEQYGQPGQPPVPPPWPPAGYPEAQQPGAQVPPDQQAFPGQPPFDQGQFGQPPMPPGQFAPPQPEQYQVSGFGVDPMGQPAGFGQPPQPTSGAPYPPAQPASGAPFGQPPISGAPYPPAPTSGMPYPPPTSGAPYPPPQPTSGMPFGQQPQGAPFQPTSGMPGQPGAFPADPYGQPQFGVPPYGPPQQPKRRGVLITVIALVALVVLGGGGVGAYLLFGRSEGKGVATPNQAVNDFLVAVFKDKDAAAADKLTCASARNSDGMRKRVDQLRSYELKYKSPTYTWTSPTVVSQQKESATLTTSVKLTTSDDRIAEQALKFLTIKADGWLVCEINPA